VKKALFVFNDFLVSGDCLPDTAKIVTAGELRQGPTGLQTVCGEMPQDQ